MTKLQYLRLALSWVPYAPITARSASARLGPNEKPAKGAFTPPFPAGYWREKPQHTPEEIALHHRLHVARHH